MAPVLRAFARSARRTREALDALRVQCGCWRGLESRRWRKARRVAVDVLCAAPVMPWP